MSDYYEILGLKKGAAADEIKASYRKLAMKYHPDRNKGDKASEEKFKEISEAYAVLSDPDKKQQYDTVGSNQFHQRYSQDDIFRGADFGNIFNEFGGGFDDIISRMFGGGARGGRHQAQQTRGQDVEYPVTVSFDEAYRGGERAVNFRLSDGDERKMTIKIPAGIQTGGRLRVAGKGARSNYGGQPGDLFIIVTVAEHPVFTRLGPDIEVKLPIKVSEALMGTSATVETPEGPRKIKVPAGVRPGTKIRLKDLGFPIVGQKERGHLYAIIDIALPTELSSDQRRLVEQMAAAGL